MCAPAVKGLRSIQVVNMYVRAAQLSTNSKEHVVIPISKPIIGEAEKEAWGWLMEHLARYRTEKSGEKT